MILTQSTIDEIKKVKNDYERKYKLADKTFMKEVLSILKQESKLYWHIKYEFLDDKNQLGAFIEEDIMYFQYEQLLKYCMEHAKHWEGSMGIADLTPIINLYFIVTMFHETSHIWQIKGLSENKEVNRFYQDVYKKFEEYHLLFRLKYYFNPLIFSFERHANIDSYRETSRIYQGTIYHDVAEANHMFVLNYLKNMVSPVSKTIKMAHLKEDYDFSGLSTYDALEFGSPLDEKILTDIDDVSIDFAKGNIEYPEAIETIKLLAKKRDNYETY